MSPVCAAAATQEMQIEAAALEPEFRQAKDAEGRPVPYVLCNKGL